MSQTCGGMTLPGLPAWPVVWCSFMIRCRPRPADQLCVQADRISLAGYPAPTTSFLDGEAACTISIRYHLAPPGLRIRSSARRIGCQDIYDYVFGHPSSATRRRVDSMTEPCRRDFILLYRPQRHYKLRGPYSFPFSCRIGTQTYIVSPTVCLAA
jgi:hypothetical protein